MLSPFFAFNQETSFANLVGELRTFPYEASVVRKVFYTFLHHKKGNPFSLKDCLKIYL